jgi:hypothetical protein
MTTRLIKDIEGRNDNNHWEMAPFTFIDNKLVFDSKLWGKLDNTWLKEQILNKFSDVVLQNGVLNKNRPCDNYWILYNLFNNWTSGEKWYNLVPRGKIVEIPIDELPALINISTRLILCGGSIIRPETLLIPKTLELLKTVFDVPAEDGYFIKTEHCSVKKDYKPHSVYTPLEALEHILGSRNCASLLISKHQHYLLLSPWIPVLEPLHNEFRAFVKDGIVTGISQQVIYKVSNVMLSVWSKRAEEIYLAVDKLKDIIEEACNYDEYIIDLWISGEDDLTANLIEINGRGGWGPAGASLFSWQFDPPNDKRELLIRY